MKISTKGRYALRMMLDIAQYGKGEFVKLKDVAVRQSISEKYLEQITALLVKAGLLKGLRGAQGGYKLTKDPAQYSVASILRVTEGSLAPVACLDDEPNLCPGAGECLTLGFWKKFDKKINGFLESTSLQDILDENNGLIGNDYSI